MKQTFLFVSIFSFLALLQTSFMAHFTIQGFVIPIVMIAVFMLSVFARVSSAGLLGVFIGGVLLDVFSQYFFGYWTVIAVLMFCVVSFIIHTYVRIPFLKRDY